MSLNLFILKSEIPFQEPSNESIIWNIHLIYPLALICRYCINQKKDTLVLTKENVNDRDSDCLDLYNLESGKCVKRLKHESKVSKRYGF